jgi:DNA-binding NarL/FixJ family response regulator
MQLLRQRIHALSGRITVEATPGWGTEMAIAIPLDPPRAVDPAETAWDLRPRELEVVELLVVGRRNKAIAEELSISENTVKFHISRVLRKLGASSRAEAVGMILAARPGFLS